MRCPECNAEIPDNLQLCPECGTMMEETRPMRAHRRRPDASVAAPKTSSRWRTIRTIMLWALGFLLVLVLSVGGAAYWGIHQGERDREQQRLQTAEEHYHAGLQRLDAGEHQLAIAEFEYALKLNPNHPYAQQGIDEARARIRQLTAMPTPTPETDEASADDLYQTALAEYKAESWRDAVSTLTQLRSLDPSYRREEIEEMLFTSLYNAGMALLEKDRFEEGIFYLDQAVALRPLDEEALTQRSLAIQYMTALGYWGVDWETCIARFERLYAAEPNYKDVFQRLYRAHVNYGNAWYDQGEMCPAEEQYTLALQLMNDPSIEEKRKEAESLCLVATPTPIAPVTGTMPVTLNERPPGFNTGRLAYPVYDAETGLYDIYVLSADLRLVRMATGADQPWWWGDRGTLLYRDRTAGGIGLLASGEATPRQIAAGAGLNWPSFSPDGTRVVYAAQNAAGTWQVYIGPSDGTGQPKRPSTRTEEGRSGGRPACWPGPAATPAASAASWSITPTTTNRRHA